MGFEKFEPTKSPRGEIGRLRGDLARSRAGGATPASIYRSDCGSGVEGAVVMTSSQRRQLKVSQVGLPGSDLLSIIAMPQIGQLWNGGRDWDGMIPGRSEYGLIAMIWIKGVGFQNGQRKGSDQQ